MVHDERMLKYSLYSQVNLSTGQPLFKGRNEKKEK